MSAGADVPDMTKVTVWNEFVHEQENDAVAEIYPDGIHATIADALEDHGFETGTATLQEPDHGLTEEVLEETDVLTWWGHAAHDDSIAGSRDGRPRAGTAGSLTPSRNCGHRRK